MPKSDLCPFPSFGADRSSASSCDVPIPAYFPDPTRLLRETLKRGRLVDDRVFDEIYPLRMRRLSATHWTPVEVAVRAAKLLALRPGARILDVGSGVGKFCIVAAACVDARIHGVEHRPHLIEIAARAARHVGVDVTFTYGTLDASDPRDVNGIYLFNPFGENLCPSRDWIDPTVEISEARFERDVALSMEFLRATRIGTRVVTYCGFGGLMPSEFRLVTRETCAGRLELWEKTTRSEPCSRNVVRLGNVTLSALRARVQGSQ